MATVLLACDVADCHAVPAQGTPGQSVEQLRDKLARVGWLSDPGRDVDVCPRCVSRGHRP